MINDSEYRSENFYIRKTNDRDYDNFRKVCEAEYLDHLIEAFLISKADRYDIKGRKYVGANLKYYSEILYPGSL